MSERRTAQIFITKLAAAERQLNAAIPMTLSSEDDLAIHTVAAAAYHILRDLKQKRGGYELNSLLGTALYSFACDLAIGRLGELPAEIASSIQLSEIVYSIYDDIKLGKIPAIVTLT